MLWLYIIKVAVMHMRDIVVKYFLNKFHEFICIIIDSAAD